MRAGGPHDTGALSRALGSQAERDTATQDEQPCGVALLFNKPIAQQNEFTPQERDEPLDGQGPCCCSGVSPPSRSGLQTKPLHPNL